MRQYSFYPGQPNHFGFLILVTIFALTTSLDFPATGPYFYVKNKEVRADGYTSITVLINNLPEEVKVLKFKVKAGNVEKEASVSVASLKVIKQNSLEYTWQGLIPIGMIEIKLTDLSGKDISKPKREFTAVPRRIGLPTFKKTNAIASNVPKRDSIFSYTIELKEIKDLDKVFIVVYEEKTMETIFQYLDKPKFVFSFETRVDSLVLLARGYRKNGISIELDTN